MADKEIKDKIRRYVEAIKDYFDVEMVILYSSYARSETREYSDIDVDVIVRDHPDIDYLEQLQLLYRMRGDIDDLIEPALFYSEDVENREEASFISEILRTGEVIYREVA